ncbi:hypothetical protein K439DRAFT_1637133 [Ramaria rubella]|nr:hypothetical protein K439DRAFT_1637133 [Ramaria rubella]
MHYMFESVSKHLCTGGVFFGAGPNADFLLPSKRTATRCTTQVCQHSVPDPV